MGDPRPSTRRLVAWPVAGLLPLLAVLGCSATGGDTAASTASPPIKVTALKDPGNIEQPLNGYILTQRQSQLAFAAEQRLRVRCAARFGLRWEPPPVNLDVPDTFRYGADAYVRYDEDAARRYGYHAAPADGTGADLAGDPAQEVPTAKLSPQLRAVLTGQGSRTVAGQEVPEGGCVEEARRELREGTDPRWNENYPNALAIDLQGKIDEDPRAVAVLARWSGCMKASGFAYKRPKDAWADPRWKAADTASAEEKAVAVAEVECGRKAEVAETLAAVERAYQTRVVDEKSQELAEYTRGKEAVLRHVAQLLGR